jgi:hypothetical protein
MISGRNDCSLFEELKYSARHPLCMLEHLLIFNSYPEGYGSLIYSGPPLPDASPGWKEICDNPRRDYTSVLLRAEKQGLFLWKQPVHNHLPWTGEVRWFTPESIRLPMDEQVRGMLTECLQNGTQTETMLVFNSFPENYGSVSYSGPPLPDASPRWKEICGNPRGNYTSILLRTEKHGLFLWKQPVHNHLPWTGEVRWFTPESIRLPMDEQVKILLMQYLSR